MSDVSAGPALRVGRGLVVAAVAAALGLVAHVGAGGVLPQGPWLAATFIGVAAVTIGSLGVPAGLLRLVVLVAGGQFFTHLMLTALAGHAGDHPATALAVPDPSPGRPMAADGSDRVGSLHDLTMTQAGQKPGVELGASHWLTHVVEDLTGPHALMALLHVAAAVIVAWWLAQGESALWRLLLLLGATAIRTFSAVKPVLVAAIPDKRGRSRHAGWWGRSFRPLVLLAGGLDRRGPPAVVI